MEKLIAFRLFVIELIFLYDRKNGVFTNPNNSLSSRTINDLDLLKVMKLLFFITSESSNNNNLGLFQYFNNFYALPYGHVEIDIYTNLSDITEFRISKDGLNIPDNSLLNFYNNNNSEDFHNEVQNAINAIELNNQEFFNYKSFELVELSHSRDSWRIPFKFAKSKGKNSIQINNDLIRFESKFYHL